MELQHDRSIDELIAMLEGIPIRDWSETAGQNWRLPRNNDRSYDWSQGSSATSYSSSPQSSTSDQSQNVLRTGYPVRGFYPVAGKSRQPVNKWSRKRGTAVPQLLCTFCKKNGETKELYSTHVLKDSNGIIVCPVLRNYPCPICGIPGGDFAHTMRYCPQNPDRTARSGRPIPELLRIRPNSTGKRGR